MRELIVPRINGNDDTCRLVEWAFADGAKVDENDTVAVVETAKAATDLCPDTSGIVQSLVPVGAECRVGDVIGYIFGTESERQDWLRDRGPVPAAPTGPEPAPHGAPVITEPARELAAEAGLDEDRLRALDKRIIRRSDVEALIAEEGSARASVPISERQRAVGRVVSRSHRTVPSAFVVMKVHCDALLARLHDWNAAHDAAVGIPEAAIRILAGLRERHPAFFGLLEEDDRLTLSGAETNIGITIDVGTGLFVPVVRNAAALTASQIADRLTEFRLAALRDSFRTEDLSGGQISISLHTETDVLAAVPIILAPQISMLSLPSVQTELVEDEADPGRVRRRVYLAVGLAYDHRVVNGREAMEFLKAFKAVVERPEEVVL